MIIGISGRIGSGKDEIGKIIQHLTYCKYQEIPLVYENRFPLPYIPNQWQIKKFAGKLKEIVSILTGIPVSDLENRDVKDSVLGEEWKYRVNQYNGQWIVGWEDKNYTVRELLQKVGTEAMRNVIHPDVWVNALFSDYKENVVLFNEDSDQNAPGHLNTPLQPNWIITDVRFPNEAVAVKKRNGLLIKVVRLNTNASSEDMVLTWPHGYVSINEHESEKALDGHEGFDIVIENNGTIEELTEQVKQFLIKFNLI